ncbi:cyclopentanone 1,2-monooxygenase [Xylariales sp. AK1849]|nr:cyclopentanone 1,2-monooxygenase [Xylariales sp. AK1849]
MDTIKENLDHQNLNGVVELDVVVVGAGFGGVYQLKKLRDEGYKVKILEAGAGYGGVWWFNAYPGARVDTPIPLYELDDPALWKDWSWTQRFPDHTELRAYFNHVAEKWDLRKDTHFNSLVQSATWDHVEFKWNVRTKDGNVFKAKYLLLNTGFAAKRYIPEWKGSGLFAGLFIHPSYWPHAGLDLRGKKVAIVGTGSTGVQLATELTPIVGELTVFQRSINTCTPMRQVNYQNGEQSIPRNEYPDLFKNRAACFTGLDFHFLGRSTFDDDLAKRQEIYERLWAEGDFRYWLAGYDDTLFDENANREAYDFWRDKTRARIDSIRHRDLLAPMKQPFSFGCRRVSLENGYFEIFNQPHVNLVDVNATPIQEITEKGIKTSKKEWEFDVIICATGYDALTGGLRQIDIRGSSGESLHEHWKTGTYTHLGMCVSGFPNMFFTYGPQAPSAFCNGPTCAQLQGDWIVGALTHMREENFKAMTAEREAELQWRDNIARIADATLLPGTKSWYMGDNIPGKTREPLLYLAGVSTYAKTIKEAAANGYTGFKFDQ